MRVALLTGLFSCFLFVSVSSPAYANFLEFFFPSLKKEEYDPTEHMIAPFAVGEGLENKERLQQLPVNSVPLEKPHRVGSEIANWVMAVVGEAMNFESNDYEAEIKQHSVVFDTIGLQQYREFLEVRGISKVASAENLTVTSYVEGVPLLLNEGVIKGRYRWLFRVPVVMTYMDRDMVTYKRAREEPLSQRVSLNVQIGRVESTGAKMDGLQVEQWSGTLEVMNK